jgi:ribosomal protein S18 acetylase RimI-like enzyme
VASEPWHVQDLRAEHLRTGFSCGHASLDTFLKERAGQHQKKGISRTFVAVRPPDLTVRGYYSLATGSVSLGALTDDQRRKLPSHPIPIVLLGRLAVDAGSRGQGLGEHLLLDAMRRVVRIAHEVGIHAIEVDAIDDSAKRFYRKYGFTELADDPRHLYIPLTTVRKLNLG